MLDPRHLSFISVFVVYSRNIYNAVSTIQHPSTFMKYNPDPHARTVNVFESNACLTMPARCTLAMCHPELSDCIGWISDYHPEMPAQFEFVAVLHSPLLGVMTTSHLDARSYFLIPTQYCWFTLPIPSSQFSHIILSSPQLTIPAWHMNIPIHSEPLLSCGVPIECASRS